MSDFNHLNSDRSPESNPSRFNRILKKVGAVATGAGGMVLMADAGAMYLEGRQLLSLRGEVGGAVAAIGLSLLALADRRPRAKPAISAEEQQLVDLDHKLSLLNPANSQAALLVLANLKDGSLDTDVAVGQLSDMFIDDSLAKSIGDQP